MAVTLLVGVWGWSSGGVRDTDAESVVGDVTHDGSARKLECQSTEVEWCKEGWISLAASGDSIGPSTIVWFEYAYSVTIALYSQAVAAVRTGSGRSHLL